MRCFAFIALASCAGCAVVSTADIPAGLRVATVESVSRCRLIGDVHGVSGLYGVFAERGLAAARQQAFAQAAELGAGHGRLGSFHNAVWLDVRCRERVRLSIAAAQPVRAVSSSMVARSAEGTLRRNTLFFGSGQP